jgi:hypothetical protein
MSKPYAECRWHHGRAWVALAFLTTSSSQAEIEDDPGGAALACVAIGHRASGNTNVRRASVRAYEAWSI